MANDICKQEYNSLLSNFALNSKQDYTNVSKETDDHNNCFHKSVTRNPLGNRLDKQLDDDDDDDDNHNSDTQTCILINSKKISYYKYYYQGSTILNNISGMYSSSPYFDDYVDNLNSVFCIILTIMTYHVYTPTYHRYFNL